MITTAFCDNIIIHYYPNDKIIKTLTTFRRGNKIINSMAMADLDGVIDYMERHEFCTGVKYRVITHRT